LSVCNQRKRKKEKRKGGRKIGESQSFIISGVISLEGIIFCEFVRASILIRRENFEPVKKTLPKSFCCGGKVPLSK